MQHILKPVPRVGLRVMILIVFLLPLVFSSTSWLQKLVIAAVYTVLFGSFRRTAVRNARLERGLVIGFYPLKVRKWSLEGFVEIEVDLEAGAGWGVFFVFGPLQWVWCYVLDWLFPWFGGRYRLWLRSAKGRRILAWQGNSDDAFQENLRHLESITGLEINRTGSA